ncbi:MAG: hypothetical protein V4598_03730 [Bdellovibrionota bacterium]
MKYLILFFIPVLVFAAGPECRRPCETPGSPEVPGFIQDIRENVTGDCTEVEEIVVRPPNPDDPCNFANIDGALFHSTDGGGVSWMGDVDKSYPASGRCVGDVVKNLCYIRSNSIYAESGSTRWHRDENSGGYILEVKQSQDCRDHKNNMCAVPYEREQLSLAVNYEDVYDAQNRDDSIVECLPANCYSITIGTNYHRTPGGYRTPIFQMVTVTRERDGTLKTRLYVNGPVFTSRVAVTGRVGENRFRPELIGRRADTFPSCSEDFNERRASYFPRR